MYCIYIIVQEWLDERLTWDPSDYDNIHDIVIQAHRIWTPELALINGSLDVFISSSYVCIKVNVVYSC